ncbi:MAG: penicillin-binding protein 2 [Gammaproteobacteria bacterium]|nr:MAG: penicillin-binding protein 2 [Gammaproteobacteria bacterium]
MIAYSKEHPIKEQRDEQRLFQHRAGVAFIVIVVSMLALLGRYVWLQVFAHENFATRSESNRVSIRPVEPNRGLIYDRRGRVIAENRPTYRLEIVPEKVEDIEALLDELSELIALSEYDRKSFAKSRRHFREFDSVPVKFNLSEQEVARFSVNRHRFDGADVVPYLSRYYPYGELLTHVIGYVGRLDAADIARTDAGNYRGTRMIGKIGIERFQETKLHGTSGFERVETNASGRVLRVLERQDAVPGTDLVLSIDVAVQQAAWDALGEWPGAVVAIDPLDGSVIALVSKPGYDPNMFAHGISQQAYNKILDAPGRPLFNRALQGGYMPGSTIKPFIGLAGLELGVVTAQTRVFSNGTFYIEGYDRPYRDWKESGHGWVTIGSALEQSVNTYFYQLAMDLGIDRIHDYLAQFGFGSATGIDVPGESKGLLPSREWKRKIQDEPWYPGETVIAGIGQGFNLVTPLQLANAVATLVNGGNRYAPRLLYATKQAGDERSQRVRAPLVLQVSKKDPQNWQVVLEGMDRVVNGRRGTARVIAVDSRYRVAGKTGTAQVYQLGTAEKYEASEVAQDLRDHALFVAFAPVESPRIAIAVVVEHGGAGSRVAAPVARATLDAWLDQEIEQKPEREIEQGSGP